MEHMVRIVGPHCCGVQQHRFGLQKKSETNTQPALQVLAESGSSAKEADLWTRIQFSPVKTAEDLMALEGFADLLGRPWRRGYRSKGLAVEPRFADSVHFCPISL